MAEPEPGNLWLGDRVDAASGESIDEQLEVEAADLTTHGAIVGMTGSGKTGLGIILLEEALLAGIPALVLDPKGDMGNLLLTFPELASEDFAPWVSDSDARKDGVSVEEHAAKTAETWRSGLERNGIGPERIKRLRDNSDMKIYTPGSSAGIPLNIVGSLSAPALSWDTEAETLRDEIEGTVTSLLALVGIEADPISSREHVLLANLIEHGWRQGRDMDLGVLISEVQSPPLRKLGVFEMDSFFPPKERTELALQLNALVASPAFAAWSEGEPLDPAKLLAVEAGKPRASIIYLAHLSEEERQFVVTLLLSKVVTWMRAQEGTSDLRALVYMDEVFGFVPPTAAPPAKKPILTILKQARAFGVGMVLSTQNPVDLDYKAMSNAATWLVGRLQTERDKARVLEGLKSAAGGTDVDALDATIGGLQKRQFLRVSAHESEPAVFSTRWAMSYLRGPLTREQIGELMEDEKKAPAAQAEAAALPADASVAVDESSAKDEGASAPSTAGAPAGQLAENESPVAPQVASGTPARYLDAAAAWAGEAGYKPDSARLSAMLAIRFALKYDETKADLDHHEEWEAIVGPLDEGLDLDNLVEVDYDERDLLEDTPEGVVYVLPDAKIANKTFFSGAAAELERRLIAERKLELLANKKLKLYSRPGEDGAAFDARCDAAAQERADEETAKITKRLEAKADKLARAVEEAQLRAQELEAEERSKANRDLIAGAGAVLGALFGGRRSTRSITRAAERAVGGRRSKSTFNAQVRASKKQQELEELEQQILDEVAEIDTKWRDVASQVETLDVGLEAADVKAVHTALVWVRR
ncbi:MAG: ATP-binding protein [Gaiellaceae bacterium]